MSKHSMVEHIRDIGVIHKVRILEEGMLAVFYKTKKDFMFKIITAKNHYLNFELHPLLTDNEDVDMKFDSYTTESLQVMDIVLKTPSGDFKYKITLTRFSSRNVLIIKNEQDAVMHQARLDD